MARIFLHINHGESLEPTNIPIDLAKIPQNGDFVVVKLNPETTDESWCKVYLVAHIGFDDADYDAEVFTVERDYKAEIEARIAAAA